MDPDSDPQKEPSLCYDDSEQRAQRVYQIVHQRHYAQRPLSRTLHFVSNVELNDEASDGGVIVQCNTLIYELRPGAQGHSGLGMQRSMGAHCEYHFRYVDQWLIELKKVLLLDRDQPIHNLTFIL